jgi:hypothetical protein
MWVMTEAPHSTKDPTLLSVFMFFFCEIIPLLEETDRYYHQDLDTLDK